MTLTLQEIAKLCGGELNGDPGHKITGVASLDEAVEGEIAFYNNPKYMPRLRKTRASAVLVPSDFSEKTSAAQIRVADPSTAFEQVVIKLAPKPVAFVPGTHATAIVDPSAQLRGGSVVGKDCRVGAGAVLEETILWPGAQIASKSELVGCIVRARKTVTGTHRNIDI